jgi:nicotinamide-nucleotide amidase
LLGHLIDTNAAHVARALADHGVDVFAKHSVGDNAARLETMLRGALERVDGVITTGGLGPTVDDLTKDAVAAAAGTTLELHEPSLRAIEARFAALGRPGPISENNRRQALLPRGCIVLENPNGTAPGFIVVRADGKFVACLPGVPREMKPMLAEKLVPWIVAR